LTAEIGHSYLNLYGDVGYAMTINRRSINQSNFEACLGSWVYLLLKQPRGQTWILNMGKSNF